MNVMVLPAKPAGTGRPLATYILDLKHETPGERLGPYISGLDTHKVEWARHSNINADGPASAIAAIEWYNAQNFRRHRVSRWEHIVVSFAEGERPTREQMAVIEDRLMEGIGFGDHPRISAVHRNTDNLHLHIGVSRIDPTTLHAEHPRHNHFRLQAEAARLELDLGLRQERKTLLARERREIDSRQALARELAELRGDDSPHTNPFDQLPADLKVDETVVFAGRSYEALGERIAAAHYAAFTGDKTPLKELQNRDLAARDKKRLLSREDAARERNKMQGTHRGPTPADALKARYETEKAIAVGNRKQAEQAVYDRFSTYHQGLSAHYNVRYEQEKQYPRQPHRVLRQQSRELLRAEQIGNRVQAQEMRAQQLAAIRKEHPLPNWTQFLERESGRGDLEAAKLLQQQRARDQQHQRGHER